MHRPPDSRLLTNLLREEREYTRQLTALVPQTSLASYAAASAPPTSHVILAVAGYLATAHDALRRYASAVDECTDHLKGLKDLEDEIGDILRDREILSVLCQCLFHLLIHLAVSRVSSKPRNHTNRPRVCTHTLPLHYPPPPLPSPSLSPPSSRPPKQNSKPARPTSRQKSVILSRAEQLLSKKV